MVDNVQRSKGRSGAYKLDRGGAPAESGPFIGEVRNNVDPTRSGRVQVWIEDFAGPDKNNPSLWRDVSYVSPFYGRTQQSGTNQGPGSYVGNSQSYGFWTTPPDIGTRVVCFFASGDPNQGYYTGCVVEPGLNHMLPAIGASANYVVEDAQSGYFSGAPRLPVVEINDDNPAISDNPRFFEQPKPVHSYLAGVMLQQGVLKDPVRGPIGSNSQRESPSSVYGMSTPGRPVYSGGLNDSTINRDLNTGTVNPQQASVIARRGGHSIVMDDGDLSGNDQLIRIRTATGHQIMLSDSGDCLHIMHANGQTWMELGSEGTVDVYASNSINLRSGGDVNIHADKNINLNANVSMNLNSSRSTTMETSQLNLIGRDGILNYSQKYIGVKSDGTLSLESGKSGTWNGGTNLTFSAGCISLNGGSAPSVPKAQNIVKQRLPDTIFQGDVGWTAVQGKLETVVSRAPTHEPFPGHGTGVSTTTSYSGNATNEALDPVTQQRFDEIQDVEFDAVTSEDFEIQAPSEVSVGKLAPEQVTGLLASASKQIPQDFNTISDTLGVGKFGFSPGELENAGLLKPGTTEFFLQDNPTNITAVLESPSVWTGKNGVDNLGSFLGDEILQDNTKTELFNTALTDLRNTGIVTGNEAPEKLGGLINAASKKGTTAVSAWVADTPISDVFSEDNATLFASDSQKNLFKSETQAVFKSDMDKLVRSGEYGVQFATDKVDPFEAGFTNTSTGSRNTTVRRDIDTAVTQVINNEKVQGPSYTRTANPVPSAERAEILRKLDAVDQEIESAGTAFRQANPGATGGDFLRSSTYRTLKSRRDALYRELNNL